jgi:Fur family transcriptional regulator, ferric uptake regulator
MASDVKKKVKKVFLEYLEGHQLRKTPERFAILEEIYSRTDHFDAEALYNEMLRKNYPISRATVYNTLELLQKCALIKKHQFGTQQALYEKSYGFGQHDHIICVECHQVVEFCDPRIQQISNTMGQLLDFKIEGHSLTMIGLCGSCRRKQNQA